MAHVTWNVLINKNKLVAHEEQKYDLHIKLQVNSKRIL